MPAFLPGLLCKDANFAVISPGSPCFTIAVPEFGRMKLDFNVSLCKTQRSNSIVLNQITGLSAGQFPFGVPESGELRLHQRLGHKAHLKS